MTRPDCGVIPALPIGHVATNTIAQGDTRDSGLKVLARAGARIFAADSARTWPGEAAVVVSVVHVATGTPASHTGRAVLNGQTVAAINSRLSAGNERPDLLPLAQNTLLRFSGCKVYGEGFVIGDDERRALAAQNPRNALAIFPYLGGEDVNTRPDQGFSDYVINFEQRPLDECAQAWPALVDIVRERVKPDRDLANESTADGAHRKRYWWQFAQPRPDLFAALSDSKRCLTAARVTRHLCFSFQPTGRVWNEKLFVFALWEHCHFAILQSRVNDRWAWALSSTMKTDLNYSVSDAFDPFPFPQPDPRTVIPALEDIGQRLYDVRAKYMVDEQVGLTITYNRLKDPTVTEARILELRRLHEEMDAAVLAAYGWSDIPVPPFCLATDADQKAFEAFESQVIDRLFALNAKRAEEERIAGATSEPKAKGAKKVAAKKEPKGGTGQTDLF